MPCILINLSWILSEHTNSIEYPKPTETLRFYGAPQSNRVRAVLMRGQFFSPLKSHRMELTQARLHQRAIRRRVENFIIISSATTSSHSINLLLTASVQYFTHSPAFHDSIHILEQHSNCYWSFIDFHCQFSSVLTMNQHKVMKIDHHRGPVVCVAVSSTSGVLVSGSMDATICLWSLETYELLNLMQFNSPVLKFRLSPDSVSDFGRFSYFLFLCCVLRLCNIIVSITGLLAGQLWG